MKRILTLLFLPLFFACEVSVDDLDFLTQGEEDILQYLDENNIEGTKAPFGLYYSIINPGNGLPLSLESTPKITYTASFLNGENFYESDSNGEVINLNENIPGWSEILPLFNEGGEGIFFIPANLFYGAAGVPAIAKGAILVFEFKILHYQTENKISEFISENNLDAKKTDSGLYYVMDEVGDGQSISNNSDITVIYKGYFLNGVVFDQSGPNGITFNLNQVIPGWKEGIPLFNEGGKGKLIIPPYLGYGSQGIGAIPGGAVLVFDIEILKTNA